MTDDNNPKVQNLEDLNVATVRRGNEYVDERMAEMEEKISTLEEEKAQLESEKADLEEEKETAEALLADFRDEQRNEQLQRIKEANKAVADDDEVDLSTLEDASVDQLKTVADMLESAAETSGVSNAQDSPDLSQLEAGNDGTDPESAKLEVAEEHGLGEMYRSLKADDSGNNSAESAIQQLAAAFEENNDRAGDALDDSTPSAYENIGGNLPGGGA